MEEKRAMEASNIEAEFATLTKIHYDRSLSMLQERNFMIVIEGYYSLHNF